MPDNKKKKTVKDKVILISGILWIAIAALGMLFDPEKYIIISSQLVLGTFIIIYYLFFRK
jgi:hypothetical protein